LARLTVKHFVVVSVRVTDFDFIYLRVQTGYIHYMPNDLQYPSHDDNLWR